MTGCDHRLGDRTGLVCVLPANHPPGCVFHASWCEDHPRDEETDR